MSSVAALIITLALSAGQLGDSSPTRTAAAAAPTAGASPQTIRPASTLAATLEAIEKVFKILAYVVGAAWVYFNFFKGRTYHPRLETKVSGQLFPAHSPPLFKSVIQVKNVGLSKVSVFPTGTALRVLAYDASAAGNWRHLMTVPVLERHQWIEPGETVQDQSVTPIGPGTTAVRIELAIKSEKTTWEDVAIVV